MRLRRVRLDGVGHPDARFDPLALDFRGANGQALDTVIWLRNAGGKTSLLSLIFSVLQPNRNLFLGYLQKGRVKSLDRYVLRDDVSHVALEWEEEGAFPGAARGLITGVAMGQRQGAGGEDNLERFFYGLVPIEGACGLEDIPMREGDRRVPFKRFRHRLEEIAVEYPATDLVIREHQNDWLEYLERRDLDPEIFRIQLNMNRDEGGAVEILRRFSNADTFIDFLVDVVSNPADADEVAANLALVAGKIEQRPLKEKERLFVAGAIDRLRPLTEAHAEWSGLRERHNQILFQGSRLRRQIALSAEAAGERAAAKATEAQEQAKAMSEAERQRSTYERQANAFQLEALRFEIEERKEAVESARQLEQEAKSLIRAWHAAEIVEELNEVEAEIEAKRAAVDRAALDAAGVRSEYEAATMRLRMYLERLARSEEKKAEHATEMATASRQRRLEAEQKEVEARMRAGQIEIELRHLEEKVSDLRSRLEALIRDGLVERGETAGQALERLRRKDGAIDRRLKTITVEREELELIRTATENLLREMNERLVNLRPRREQTRRTIEGIERRAHEIAVNERVLEVMGHEQVDAFIAGSIITGRLISAVADTERELVDAQVETLEDRRAVQAIEEVGLLPAPLALEQAVGRLKEKMAATTGWQYLAENMPRSAWPRILATAPQLLDAVVVQPGTLEQAAAMLEGTDLASLSANLVVVESTEFESDSVDRHRLWVLPPAAARYDADAAPAERELRASRLASAGELMDGLVARRDADRELLLKVQQLQDECPPGRLDDLQFELEEQEKELNRLFEAAEAEKQKAQVARARDDDLNQEERRLERERNSLGRSIDRLEAVAGLEAQQAGWLQGQEQLLAEQSDRRREQEQSRLKKEEAGRAEDRWKKEANQASNDALIWQRRLNELPHAPVEARVPEDASLDRLEADYKTLRDQYEQRTTKSQLARDLESDKARGAKVRGRLLPYAEVEEQARLLLASPGAESAGNRAARLEAARLAEEEATRLRIQEEADLSRVEQHESELGRDRREITSLSEDLRPANRQQALQRQQEATAAAIVERAKAQAAQTARDTAQAAATSTGHQCALLESEERHLSGVLGEQAVELHASYDPIDAEEAKREVEQIVGDLRDAGKSLGEAEERSRKHAQQVRYFAARAEFEELEGPHRDRLTTAEDRLLSQQAQTNLEEFERLLPFLVHQLQEIDKHQARVTDQLLVLVDQTLQYLRWLQRQELPEGLGGWTGERYFLIRYDIPESMEERRLRVGTLLRDLVDSKRKLGGTELLQQALRVVNRRAHFEVSVLKPNEGLRPERASVADIGAWSGGQKLTTAILIYCALAHLRADNRSRSGSSPVGVLLLDNPIGTANLSTLIDLQRQVAEKFGVQLVYTTALDDKPALAPFTNIIRLGNRRERRRDRGHIVQEDVDKEQKIVEAARIFRRQAITG